MPLGTASRSRLLTCDTRLQRLVESVAADVDAGLVKGVSDITVACGHRGQLAQDEAYARGASKLKWPHSKHNSMPSRAVDVWPFPVNWSERGKPEFEALRGAFASKAKAMGIPLRHISWDLPHHELDD